MENKQKIIVAGAAILLAGIASYLLFFRGDMQAKKVMEVKQQVEQKIGGSQKALNPDDISPIAGLPCTNKDLRPVAVMQPADVSARPAAGFSEADMMFEMLAFTTSATRLMGVYQCTIPNEIGSIRSARHDYISMASGLGAVFVHWGYSHFAEALLDQKVINNINCLTTSYCERWQMTGKMRLEDTGHITKANIEKAEQDLGYSTTNTFTGYPHQEEAPLDQRPEGGHLRIAYVNPNDVDYDYDKITNAYLRTWNGVPDTDKNSNKRVAPKNIVVMYADTEMITLDNEATYKANGVQDPWELIPEGERAGINGIPGAPTMGRYNNLQIGDPWFDWKDSGEAYFYMNGQQIKGTWKKDKNKIDSKLTFFDESGVEISFVPGQIWVEVMAPGQGMKWTPGIGA